MKKKLHRIPLLIGIIAATSLAANAEPGDGQRQGPGGPRPLPPEVVKEFDADGDGKLNEAERATAREAFKAKMEERKATFIKEHDTDGDGELSDAERETAREKMKAKFEEKRQELLGKYDANNKGQLDPEERKALVESTKITGVSLKEVDRDLVCPKCAETTDAVNYGGDSGIIIDRCTGCRGFWLDKGAIRFR